jgi:hypothetical protein
MAKRWLWLALLTSSLFLLNRCGNRDSQPNSRSFISHDSGTFTDIYTNTLSGQCVACHQPGSSNNDESTLDFTSQANAFTTLTTGTVVGEQKAPTCGKMPLVIANDPADSYLMGTLFADYYKGSNFNNDADCAPYQHGQQVQLSDDEKNSMLQWIQNGLPNN